jgi:hypothetical protein
VTVDWTYPECDVDIVLVGGSCTLDELVEGTCDALAVADGVTTKPERVTVASAPAGNYTLFVVNWGPETESLAFQVTLTTGGAAAAADRPGARVRLKGPVRSFGPQADDQR